MLRLNKENYSLIGSVLLHNYSYPISDIEKKTGFKREVYESLGKKYSPYHPSEIELSDIDPIVKGIHLLISELSDNDFRNLIEAEKVEASKLADSLEAAKKSM